jgi:hypothetical protein
MVRRLYRTAELLASLQETSVSPACRKHTRAGAEAAPALPAATATATKLHRIRTHHKWQQHYMVYCLKNVQCSVDPSRPRNTTTPAQESPTMQRYAAL